MLWNSVQIHVVEQLGVVCIEVMAYVKTVYPIRHVLRVESELLRIDPRTLRNTTRQTNLLIAVIRRLELSASVRCGKSETTPVRAVRCRTDLGERR